MQMCTKAAVSQPVQVHSVLVMVIIEFGDCKVECCRSGKKLKMSVSRRLGV